MLPPRRLKHLSGMARGIFLFYSALNKPPDLSYLITLTTVTKPPSLLVAAAGEKEKKKRISLRFLELVRWHPSAMAEKLAEKRTVRVASKQVSVERGR
jgi:hypothetical protein